VARDDARLELAPEAFAALPSDFLRRSHGRDNSSSWARRAAISSAARWRSGRYHRVRAAADRGIPLVHPLRDGYDAALAFNRDRMLGLLELLTQRMPASPDVFEAMTNLLEARDEIIGTPNGRYSASRRSSARAALSTETEQRAAPRRGRRAPHLKLGDFGAPPRRPIPCCAPSNHRRDTHASQLAALAAFAGPHRTAIAVSAARANSSRAPMSFPSAKAGWPPAHARGARRVRRFGAHAAGSDRAHADELRRTAVASALPTACSRRPLSLAVPCLGTEATLMVSEPTGGLLPDAAGRGARRSYGVHRMLDSLDASRRGMRPGGVSLDVIVQEAWLAEFSGDARERAHELDVALTALPTLSSFIVTEPRWPRRSGARWRIAPSSRRGSRDPRPRGALGQPRAHGVGPRGREPRADARRMRALAARQPLS
jgi:hypothetical protein